MMNHTAQVSKTPANLRQQFPSVFESLEALPTFEMAAIPTHQWEGKISLPTFDLSLSFEKSIFGSSETAALTIFLRNLNSPEKAASLVRVRCSLREGIFEATQAVFLAKGSTSFDRPAANHEIDISRKVFRILSPKICLKAGETYDLQSFEPILKRFSLLFSKKKPA